MTTTAMVKASSVIVLLLRVVAVCWALVASGVLFLLLPTGYLVGLETWAADGAAAVYLLAQAVLAVIATMLMARRPFPATVALAGIALLLAGGQVLFLHGIAGHAREPLSWEHKAWGYVLHTTIGTLAVAVALPLLGYVLRYVRASRPRSAPDAREPALPPALPPPVDGVHIAGTSQ